MPPETASNVVKIESDAQKFFAELDALGEDKVRSRLASSFYDPDGRSAVVLEWLRSKVESEAPEVRAARAAERRATAAERLARAEERRAKAAVRAKNRATIALFLAAFAAIVALLCCLALAG
jgi:hypothetical protein